VAEKQVYKARDALDRLVSLAKEDHFLKSLIEVDEVELKRENDKLEEAKFAMESAHEAAGELREVMGTIGKLIFQVQYK